VPQGAGARLERWCRGRALGWAFDGAVDEVSFDAGMVGIDLTAILDDPELVNPAAHYLLYRIRSIMDGRRVVVSLDEARAYLLNEQFRDDMQTFLPTARKNNAAVILVSQEPRHLLDGAFGSTMVDQYHTKIFFRHPTADPEVFRGQLHLTEGEFTAIREGMLPGSRQRLITRRDTGSVIVNFDLSAMPEYVAVLSGRATTVWLPNGCAKRLGPIGSQNFSAGIRRRLIESVRTSLCRHPPDGLAPVPVLVRVWRRRLCRRRPQRSLQHPARTPDPAGRSSLRPFDRLRTASFDRPFEGLRTALRRSGIRLRHP
jgi:hypothetical protein